MVKIKTPEERAKWEAQESFTKLRERAAAINGFWLGFAAAAALALAALL